MDDINRPEARNELPPDGDSANPESNLPADPAPADQVPNPWPAQPDAGGPHYQWEPPVGDAAAALPATAAGSAGWSRAKRITAAIGAAVVIVVVAFGGVRIGIASANHSVASESIPSPASSSTSPHTTSSNSISVAGVTAKVEPGVVDITAIDGYQNGTSAGTGMVLTANGEVLTNNHVVEGGTSITAQVDGAGTKYKVKVLGENVTQDVALVQLIGASGLKTVSVGNSSAVTIGAPVVAIGNALNLPGPPTVTTGTISALDRSITAGNQGSGTTENLSGLFQTDASLSPGNSGGPLANAAGQVIAMNTAAATTSSTGSASNVGFAIPINEALSIASKIQQGETSSTIQLGLPAFLGVTVENPSAASSSSAGFGGFYGGYSNNLTPAVSSGALVTGVESGTAAQTAGLSAGDVITAIGGTSVSSIAELKSAIANDSPGQSVSLTWVTPQDSTQTTTVTLGTGPVP